MDLFFVRHARQSSPLCNVNVDLSKEGMIQAQMLSERLKDVPFDAIYSSSLIRAIQTTEIINRYHNLKHEIRSEIKEIDFGDLTGLTNMEIRERYHDFITENDKLTVDYPYPGGECGNDVIKRVMPVIEDILKTDYKNVLIVTHGGVIRALMAHLLGLDLSQKALFGAALEHTSITQFVYDKERERFYLQRFNDHAHLEGHNELLRRNFK